MGRYYTSKKMSGVVDYIIPLGVVGVGVFVAYKMGLFTTGGPTASGQTNANAAANTASTAAAAYAASAATTPQSLTDSQLNTMVNTIMADYNSNQNIFSGTQYTDDIVTQMSNLGNITDLYRLMVLFGTQPVSTAYISLCSEFGVDCQQLDLGGFLHVVLTAAQLATVNQDLSGNGINYTFS
jgi:hypothetical protein